MFSRREFDYMGSDTENPWQIRSRLFDLLHLQFLEQFR